MVDISVGCVSIDWPTFNGGPRSVNAMLALQNPWFCWISGRQWTISSSLFEDNSPDWSTRFYLSRALLLLEPYCAWDWSWLTNICSTSYWNGSQFNSCETWIIRWMVWKPAGSSIFFDLKKSSISIHFRDFLSWSNKKSTLQLGYLLVILKMDHLWRIYLLNMANSFLWPFQAFGPGLRQSKCTQVMAFHIHFGPRCCKRSWGIPPERAWFNRGVDWEWQCGCQANIAVENHHF